MCAFAWRARRAEDSMVTRLRCRLGTALLVFGVSLIGVVSSASGQGLGGAGTLQGTVKDPTGGVMQAVEVRISNPVSGYARTAVTDQAGRYVFANVPPN